MTTQNVCFEKELKKYFLRQQNNDKRVWSQSLKGITVGQEEAGRDGA